MNQEVLYSEVVFDVDPVNSAWQDAVRPWCGSCAHASFHFTRILKSYFNSPPNPCLPASIVFNCSSSATSCSWSISARPLPRPALHHARAGWAWDAHCAPIGWKSWNSLHLISHRELFVHADVQVGLPLLQKSKLTMTSSPASSSYAYRIWFHM
jgi:hypothetical protein